MTDGPTTALMRKAYARWEPVYDLVFGELLAPGRRQAIDVINQREGSVLEVGVAGVPDAVKGEVVKAWVVKRAGASPTVDELRAYCRQHLAPYKTPAHVEFRDTLPKTMTGKVLRRALVAEHPKP